MTAHFRITVKAVRDGNNYLGFVLNKPIDQDQSDFHTLNHILANPAYASMSEKPSTDQGAFIIKATLYMNHKLVASTVQTGIIRSLTKVEETLIFPV